MSTPEHLLPPPPACPCVVLIGMAGAGKSTVGMALAQTLAGPSWTATILWKPCTPTACSPSPTP